MSERHNLLRMDDDAETGFRSEFGTVGMPSLPPATPRINHEREIYPYCIVWTPLPMISWFLPFIGMTLPQIAMISSVIIFCLPHLSGHTGIGDSRGVIHDFAGPYHIGVGNLAFSKPTKYLQLDPSKCFAANWDDGLKEGCDCYRKRMHNICCDNCHSHVAKCLNVMAYSKFLVFAFFHFAITLDCCTDKVTTYGMFHIGAWVFFSGRWVSFASFIRTYTPFAIIVAIIVLASSGVFS
jgi:hypothetical protein